MKYLPHQNIDQIKGIGPSFKSKLARLDINIIRDLLHHYPSRYLDYRQHLSIKQVRDKTNVSLIATISKPKKFFSRNRKLIVQAEAADKTGKITLIWFNNPYIHRLIRPGALYTVTGTTSFFGKKISIVSPTIEPTTSNSLHTSGLVPIYPLTQKISSRFLRSKIHNLLAETSLIDPLPQNIKGEFNLIDYSDSLEKIHFPQKPQDRELAETRLVFNHHLSVNLNNQIELQKLPPSPAININQQLHHDLVNRLPFQLTPSQEIAISAGYRDLSHDRPSHRLIQGETGSGKTILIFFYANQVITNRYSFCLLAPTEILANQHYQTFTRLGINPKQLLLVTSQKPIKDLPNIPTIFIGTHALLTQLPPKLHFPLGAIAIDEQHKFGVAQRQALNQRNPSPHLFNFTATPIPRTLALGIFGEIAVTTMKSKPQNRLPVKTWFVPPERYQNSQSWIKEQLKNGSKIFVVAPLIHTSNKTAVSSVEKIYQEYRAGYGDLTHIAMIHGEMSSDHLDQTLNKFKESESGILVSTTIIEVGVDIPEADVIIIHSAERFGLASLHQLRGRVGRGQRQSYCLLVPTTSEQTEHHRLRLLEKYHSGLVLAKKDLKLRGAGELFGIKQHGHLPVRLRCFWSKSLFLRAKTAAEQIIASNPDSAAIIASKLVSC